MVDKLNEDLPRLFCGTIKNEFLQHLRDNPNNRRVSQAEKRNILDWLTNPETRPSSQQEFSRRHYVRKTFAWDTTKNTLVAITTSSEGKDRELITEEEIMDIVELVHANNGHAGWDATWKAINDSYYGILRADVIFLLKQCPICAQDPRKRPKGRVKPDSRPVEACPRNLLTIDDLLHDMDSDITEEGNARQS